MLQSYNQMCFWIVLMVVFFHQMETELHGCINTMSGDDFRWIHCCKCSGCIKQTAIQESMKDRGWDTEEWFTVKGFAQIITDMA